MKSIKLCDDYYFCNIKFNKYHYTDSRLGCPLNYIAYMKKGRAKIVSLNKSIDVNEGDMFFIPKGLCYQSYWYGENEINFLSFGFLNLNITHNTKFDLQIIENNESLRNKLFLIPLNGGTVDCRTLSLFYDAMSVAVPTLKYTCHSKEEPVLEKIKLCIQNNPHISLSEIAKQCSISEPHMYSIFKKQGEITPNDYRQKVLCTMAIDLLTTTDKSVEEISNRLNFSSSSYFRKILKKHTNSTPREIRKGGIF